MKVGGAGVARLPHEADSLTRLDSKPVDQTGDISVQVGVVPAVSAITPDVEPQAAIVVPIRAPDVAALDRY
jgi:hypothetical protein